MEQLREEARVTGREGRWAGEGGRVAEEMRLGRGRGRRMQSTAGKTGRRFFVYQSCV